MQQFEIPVFVERIFIMFAQVAYTAGVVEILQLGGVASKFLVIGADGARVLHSAVDHLLFLFPLHLKLDRDNHPSGDYRHQSEYQYQREQNVSLFPRTRANCGSPAEFRFADWRRLLLHDGFPWVSGIFCGGPLTTRS